MSKKLQDKKEKSGEFNELLKLTPRILEGEEKERIEPYLSRLKKAIDQGDILNIALTGNYGCGKSTILRTFENEYNEYKYLSISLAAFKDDQEKTDINENEEIEKNNLSNKKKTELQEDIKQQLEISILQQIFYKVSADIIPDSRFKRIRDFDNMKTTVFIILSAIWIISSFILFGFDYINDLNPRGWDFSKSPSWIAISSFSFFVFGLSYLMKYGFRSFSNSKINKLSVKGEIELDEASVFNKYLDEILYFFERTDYNVVVFEDIDRFDTTGIFTKLRELNKLINNCELIDRDINFVYAVKDTVFKDKTERVKFFDFIIPVIPFVNSKNASEQLNKLIQQYDLSDKLSNKFVSELVSFIHDIDMRLLINTFHEYNVFKDNIADDDINHEQLFSIITYKNLYPEDFSNLYRKEGNLYDVFKNRANFENTLRKKLQEKIPYLEEEIENLEKHNHVQIQELRSAYILKLLEKLPQGQNIREVVVNNKPINVFKVNESDHFHSLQEETNIQYTIHGYSGNRGSGLSFKQIEDLVNSNLTYRERVQLIEDRKNNKANSIKNEISKINEKIRNISRLSLVEIFEEINTDEVFGKFKENDLVRYLLIGGYLNENYSDYISLFHEQDLTKEEYKFKNAVKSLREPDYEFEITNHFNLLKDLDVRYFSKRQVLNYGIAEYLVSDTTKNIFPDKRETFYSSLENQASEYFEFIKGFIKAKPCCRKEFIENLIKHRKSVLDELFHRRKLTDGEILNAVKYLFEYSEAADIQKLDNLESLIEYLQNFEEPISFTKTLGDTEVLQEFVKAQKVKFKSIDESLSSSNEFLDFLIKNNAYEINYSSILTILRVKLNEVEESEIPPRIYSYIYFESVLTNVKKYVEDHINEFVSKVLLKKEGCYSENEGALVSLLNNGNLNQDLKTETVKIQRLKISSLDKLVDDEIKELVLSTNKIKPTWANIFQYYNQREENCLNDILKNFINVKENYSELSKSNVYDLQDADELKKELLMEDILYCYNLNNDAYKELLNSISPPDSINYDLLKPEKAEIILESDILELNAHNFDGLKTLQSNLHIRLIEKQIQEFIKGDNELSLDNKDWCLLLDSKKIKSTQKHKLLKDLTIQNLSDSNVAIKVLQIHPDQKINSYGFDEIRTLLSHQVSLEKKISVLLKYIDDLNNEQLETIVSGFGDDYADLFGLWKSPSFLYCKVHYSLLKNLKGRGIISSVVKEGEKIRAYCRRKN